jgi:uncharacterized protein YtpQ (UPF0354 family)
MVPEWLRILKDMKNVLKKSLKRNGQMKSFEAEKETIRSSTKNLNKDIKQKFSSD